MTTKKLALENTIEMVRLEGMEPSLADINRCNNILNGNLDTQSAIDQIHKEVVPSKRPTKVPEYL